jgi:hypothetical protein
VVATRKVDTHDVGELRELMLRRLGKAIRGREARGERDEPDGCGSNGEDSASLAARHPRARAPHRRNVVPADLRRRWPAELLADGSQLEPELVGSLAGRRAAVNCCGDLSFVVAEDLVVHHHVQSSIHLLRKRP